MGGVGGGSKAEKKKKKSHCCVGIQGVSKLEQPQHPFKEKEVNLLLDGVHLQIIPPRGLKTLTLDGKYLKNNQCK